MALTLPVSREAVAITAATSAAGKLCDNPEIKALIDQDDCKYHELTTLLESDDVDVVGNILLARNNK